MTECVLIEWTEIEYWRIQSALPAGAAMRFESDHAIADTKIESVEQGFTGAATGHGRRGAKSSARYCIHITARPATKTTVDTHVDRGVSILSRGRTAVVNQYTCVVGADNPNGVGDSGADVPVDHLGGRPEHDMDVANANGDPKGVLIWRLWC